MGNCTVTPHEKTNRGSCIVLLSGGWESALCAATALRTHPAADVQLLFIDYGQRWAGQERRAAAAVARALRHPTVHHLLARVPRLEQLLSCAPHDVVPGRNEAFIVSAVSMFTQAKEVYIGARAPLRWFDRYGDSNAQWAREVGKRHGVRIRCPALLHPKALVRARVRAYGIPSTAIYSTEKK